MRATLTHSMSSLVEDTALEEGKLTRYCQVVSYLLDTCATDDVIEEAEADITYYRQPESMSTVCYSQILWEKHYDVDKSTVSKDSRASR